MTCVLASMVQFSGSPFFICIISTRKSDTALAHWWCPALVWLHTFLYMSFSFSTEDIAEMSCEVDVLFLRLSIYTESLDDLKRYISPHAPQSYLSYQRRVVGLVWGHLKLTSKLPPDVIAFLTSKLAATDEPLPSMSYDHPMCSVRVSGLKSSAGDDVSKATGFN